MTRLQFLRSLGALGLAAVAAPLVAGCKKDDDDTTPDAGGNNNNPDASMTGPKDAAVDSSTPPPVCSSIAVVIGTNHGHALTVPPADVAAGVEKSYQIQGASSHPHTAILTAADFTTLKQTGTVTVTATGSGHPHSVTVTCS